MYINMASLLTQKTKMEENVASKSIFVSIAGNFAKGEHIQQAFFFGDSKFSSSFHGNVAVFEDHKLVIEPKK